MTAISFVSSEPDQEVLQKIQERFTVAIPTLPDTIDPATYSELYFQFYGSSAAAC